MDTCADLFKNASFGEDSEFVFCDFTQRVIVAAILAAWSLIAIIDNSLVIIAVMLTKRLRTATNVFIVNLSVADLLTGFSFAWQVLAVVSQDGWPLPNWLCSVVSVLGTTGIGCSIHTLGFIALNRLLLVTKPLSFYQTVYTCKKMAAMITLTWLVPLLTATLPGIFGLVQLGYDYKYKFCTFNDRLKMAVWYDYIIVLVNYPVPLLVVIVSYVKIYKHIKHHSTKRAQFINAAWKLPTGTRQQNQLQIDITKNTFYVVCAFVVCLTPYAICVLVDALNPAVPYTATILILNSWINPIIYATKHPHFKEIFKSICFCRCSEIPEPTINFLRVIRAKSSADFSHDGYEMGKVSTAPV
ncbi:rhodopsin, GQ-coupled-like [Patiria miniata]|uniref:G-protein coupled receptors family 1 profile domain-containing protein n=1 Tax=Patiria miniata TaxID=46514 RepID=A0A913YZF2_PATMI|nr:rhodopsin, GQ-coupled-like [Patiria miniata]